MQLYIMQLAISEAGVPAPGYLIMTDDGKNVVIDTGFGPDMVGQGGGTFSVQESDLILAQLENIGVAAGEVDYLVATHFDRDHAGYLSAFPDAEIVVQRAHYEAVTAPDAHPRFSATREQWGEAGRKYRFVDGDTELLPGIELIETSGHVPGHQSVLVRLPKTGPVLLAIDAMPRALGAHTAATRPVGQADMDEASVRASTQKLLDLIERESVTLVVYGHDADEWKKLRKAPDYYE